jgi:hypothetical protein
MVVIRLFAGNPYAGVKIWAPCLFLFDLADIRQLHPSLVQLPFPASNDDLKLLANGLTFKYKGEYTPVLDLHQLTSRIRAASLGFENYIQPNLSGLSDSPFHLHHLPHQLKPISASFERCFKLRHLQV